MNETTSQTIETILMNAGQAIDGTMDDLVAALELAKISTETLLKVRRLQKVECKIRISRAGSPERAVLLAEGESLETEIDAVIDEIEEQIGTQASSEDYAAGLRLAPPRRVASQ